MLNNMAELMSDCGYSEAIRLCDLEMGRQKYGIFIFIFDSFYIYLFASIYEQLSRLIVGCVLANRYNYVQSWYLHIIA